MKIIYGSSCSKLALANPFDKVIEIASSQNCEMLRFYHYAVTLNEPQIYFLLAALKIGTFHGCSWFQKCLLSYTYQCIDSITTPFAD